MRAGLVYFIFSAVSFFKIWREREESKRETKREIGGKTTLCICGRGGVMESVMEKAYDYVG
jgi:hypothetical protein